MNEINDRARYGQSLTAAGREHHRSELEWLRTKLLAAERRIAEIDATWSRLIDSMRIIEATEYCMEFRIGELGDQTVPLVVADARRLRARFADPCRWEFIDSGCWLGGCGIYWQFEVGGPEENECRFCPGCGHPLQAVAAGDD